LALQTSHIIRSHAAVAWANRIHFEIHENDHVSTLAIDGAMMLMVAELVRAQIDGAKVRPRWLRRVEEALEASIASPPSVEELPGIAGFADQSHFTRVFKQAFGETPGQYARALKGHKSN
jgi:AraC-like DNA-binding protein